MWYNSYIRKTTLESEKWRLKLKILIRSKAIRAKCMDCCCWQQTEVRLCTAVHCPLHPYRMGSVKATAKANLLIGREIPYEFNLDCEPVDFGDELLEDMLDDESEEEDEE